MVTDDGVVAQDVFVVKPFVEGSPVVASYEEGEADVGEVLAQRLQRVPGVGRLGHVELIVACLEFWLVGNGLFCHLEPQFVCQQVGGFFLEWVHGRNHQPHFIQPCLLAEALGKGDVPCVYGVETPAEYTHFLLLHLSLLFYV